LVEAQSGTPVRVALRFLHVVARQAMRLDGTALVPVSELEVGASRYLSWDEATEREFATTVIMPDDSGAIDVPTSVGEGQDIEQVAGTDGEPAGAIVRSWRRIDARMHVEVMRLRAYGSRSLYRLSVSVTNTGEMETIERADVVRHTLTSAHVVLRTGGGAFVSSFDPGVEFQEEATRCNSEGLWPVLVGDDGDRRTMLAAPIILYDYPRIAPESPGDLFDGGEIDQLLILNILTLTDEEQREMRDSDPRAREILDRCKGLSDDELMRLHGTVRSMQPAFHAQEMEHERRLV
jgi:hypothetical protein